MAFVERYIRSDAAGGNDGTQEIDAGGGVGPWTLAEWFAHTEGADRRGNIQSDSGYSLGVTTVQQVGDSTTLSRLRGYDTTIGDLEGQGRNADGTLNKTGFPVITLTGALTPVSFMTLENLDISASFSIPAPINGPTADNVKIISCSVLNSANNASAQAIQLDRSAGIINSDITCSGAAHATVVTTTFGAVVYGSRLKGASSSALFSATRADAFLAVFIGNNTGRAIVFNALSDASMSLIAFCTFYNLATCIELPNSAGSAIPTLVDNHPTDCTKWIDNLYAGTANIAIIEINNRTRDNTTPRTGIGDGINIGEITTDTGDKDTDYVDADNENLRLIAGAPGESAGLIAYSDVGAYQRAPGGVRPIGGGLVG